ncbi:MAG: amidohydrolase, partial [Sutterella sp.]|nr:amidohydrolase [Sutterella sp.]
IGMADETHQAAIHNPKFDFNDEILPLAVCFLSEIARSRLTELTH